jgi:hypothetical protein
MRYDVTIRRGEERVNLKEKTEKRLQNLLRSRTPISNADESRGDNRKAGIPFT